MTESTASDAGAGTCGCQDVCDLPTEALQDRLAMIRRGILPLATRREALSDGMVFEFKHAPAIQKTLEDFTEFERECCSSLTWNVRAIPGEMLRFSVQGLPPTSDFFRVIDGPGEAAAPGLLKRLTQAAGLGAGSALLLCCVLPMGVVALTGAAVAAPLAKLDDPMVISAGAAILAVPAWLWLGRRSGSSSKTDGLWLPRRGAGSAVRRESRPLTRIEGRRWVSSVSVR